MYLRSMDHFPETNEVGPGFLGQGAIEYPIDDSLLARFDSLFAMLPANTTELVRTSQQVRYQVYCIEHAHENSDNPEALESDEFDSHAAHSLLVHRATNTALGTVRIVLPVRDNLENSFPVQRVMDAESVRTLNELPLHRTAEVSRFSISRQFRRSQNVNGTEDPGFINNSGPLMRLGLLQALIRMSYEHGITHLCGAMEPTFLRMLAAMAIRFRPIGPLIEFHGLRQPCYFVVEDVLNTVKRERPAVWAMMTNGGAYTHALAC